MKTAYCIAYWSNDKKTVEKLMTEDIAKAQGIIALWVKFPSRKCTQWVLQRMNGNPHFCTSNDAIKIYYAENKK